MKAEHPTKYYSSIQEKMIASYLGWSVVVASGARRFHPGDIQSDSFLGECKTHTSPQKRISIYKSVWNKISTEAMSTFRKPVLFVDNGTQKIENTWCVLPDILIFNSLSHIGCSRLQSSETLISFEHEAMQKAIKERECVVFELNKETLLLMQLLTFKNSLEVS